MTIVAPTFFKIDQDDLSVCARVISGESKMSVVSNVHTSIVYESKGKNKTKAFDGQRLVVTIAKADGDGNYGPNLQQTMATSVPVLMLSDADWNRTSVREACTQYLHTCQNKLIAQRIKDDGLKTHSDSDIDLEHVLAYLDREASGDKWDSARIAQWFADVLGDYVGTKILEKNPNISNADLEVFLLRNQDSFVAGMKATGKKATVAMAEQQMARLMLLPEDKRDRAALRFIARMNDILHPAPVEAVEDNLGF